MKNEFLDLTLSIERLYRLFLDAMKHDLDRRNIVDITSTQCIVLYHIGRNDNLSISDLLEKKYYNGSNVSYNISKMKKNGYITQGSSEHDKRTVVLSLSEKGRTLFKTIQELFGSYLSVCNRQSITAGDLNVNTEMCRKIELILLNNMLR